MTPILTFLVTAYPRSTVAVLVIWGAMVGALPLFLGDLS